MLLRPRRFVITSHYYCFFSPTHLRRPLLKDIKKSGEVHIVLDCSTEKIQSVLKQAQQVGMMTAYHNYLITSLVSQSKTR